MSWHQLIAAMRALGWAVMEENGWVDVETPTGGQGIFAFTDQGLVEARKFYQQYKLLRR